MPKFKFWLLLVLCSALGWSATVTKQHAQPITPVLLWITLILFFAIIGRFLAKRVKQPAVLGELVMGIFLGNLGYFFGLELAIILREGSSIYGILREVLLGVALPQAVSLNITNPYYAVQVTTALSSEHGLDYFKIGYVLDVFATYGVILLLFKVGLETSLTEMRNTGGAALRVAMLGVLAPIILGFGVAMLLLPDLSYQTDLFIAATLSATSIGITARVLTELKKLRTREARTILGAAMLDDVFGLIILAMVSSIVIKGNLDLWMVGKIILATMLFFAGVLLVSTTLIRRLIKFFQLFLEPWEVKLLVTFLFIMLLALLATMVGLASIIGAFAAGVILHDGLFDNNLPKQLHSRSINNLISPLESILAPLFFILIGIQVKLELFFTLPVIKIAACLIVAAIIGKLISGIGARSNDDRWIIGIGMLPRGEVGLIFASVGRILGVISDDLFSAIILMVMVTTIIAPPLLKWRYNALQQVKRCYHSN